MEKPAAGFAGFAVLDGGQTAASNAVENTGLGQVAAKVVALDRHAGRDGLEVSKGANGSLERA